MSITERLKIIVFSDSHGFSKSMLEAAEMHKNDSNYFIFLGDGLSDAEKIRDITDKPLITVSGNCDGMLPALSPSKALPNCVIDLGNMILLLCHGHTFRVKSGLDSLVSYAMKRGVDIALFGHTHIRHDEYIPAEKDGEKALRLFNPGSISFPRSGAPSYGIISMNIQSGKRNILLSHAILK